MCLCVLYVQHVQGHAHTCAHGHVHGDVHGHVLLCTIPLPTPEDSAAASVLFN